MTNPRYHCGATVWVKGTTITSESELHRRFGSNATKVYLPCIVKEGIVRTSATGRRMRYVRCDCYLGGSDKKIVEVPLSSAKTRPPREAPTLTDTALFVGDGGKLPPSETESDQEPDLETQSPSTSQEEATWTDQFTQDMSVSEYVGSIEEARQRSSAVTTVTAHSTTWNTDNDTPLTVINGKHANLSWSIRDKHRNIHSAGSDPTRVLSHLDYFLLMFPPDVLKRCVQLTNARLTVSTIPRCW